MLDIRSLLEIRYFDGATYADNKVVLGQANTTDTESITLDTDNYIYIGYYKPIKQIYFDIPTPNTNANAISLEYFNGTDWTAMEVIDGTSNLLRSGYIQWLEISDWEANTVDDSEQYWIRISTDTLHSAATYNFIGLLYSEDRELLLENPYILETDLLMDEDNHLKAHVASRDMIIQQLSNKNYKKSSDFKPVRITAWDLLDVQEVRQAATFLALSKIYFNLSDKTDDSWANKSDAYYDRFKEQMHLAALSLDSDDDGLVDDSERVQPFINRCIVR